jgi:hypothetical protein
MIDVYETRCMIAYEIHQRQSSTRATLKSDGILTAQPAHRTAFGSQRSRTLVEGLQGLITSERDNEGWW